MLTIHKSFSTHLFYLKSPTTPLHRAPALAPGCSNPGAPLCPGRYTCWWFARISAQRAPERRLLTILALDVNNHQYQLRLTCHIHIPLLACMFFFLLSFLLFAYDYLADFVWCRCSRLLFLYSLTSMHTPWCNMETEWKLELSGQWWTCVDGKKEVKRQTGWRNSTGNSFLRWCQKLPWTDSFSPGLQPTLCPGVLFSQTWVSAVIATEWPFSDCFP